MYEYSTKPSTDKYGFDGLMQMILATGVAGLIRSYPPNLPNSRSISVCRKNGTDTETCAVMRADKFAEIGADLRAVVRAERFAESRADMICSYSMSAR